MGGTCEELLRRHYLLCPGNLGIIDASAIAIPEIQRPFAWSKTQVRDLVDSLYRGYPTGYLITWKNPDVKVKGGGTAEGEIVLIRQTQPNSR